MVLIRLTYFSRNRLDRFNAPISDRVSEILAVSAVNNRRDNVTGALVYDNKWFAQVLEGAENVVAATFERILRDQRHSDISLVAMARVAQREFPNCAMTAVGHCPENTDIFRRYTENRHFDPQLMPAARIAELIEAVVFASEGRVIPCHSAHNAA
jgi:hypothetical protein